MHGAYAGKRQDRGGRFVLELNFFYIFFFQKNLKE